MMRARGKCENDGGEDEFGDVFHAASLWVTGKRESMPFSAMIPARKDEILRARREPLHLPADF